MKIILVVLLLVFAILLIKEKLNNYVMAMWIAENNYPPPDKEDAERLAKKVTDRWFKKN